MVPEEAGCDLDGLGVLVTRPQAQAVSLSEAIELVHGRPILFPTVEILGPADPAATRRALRIAEQADLLIFVSPNAVEHAFPLLPDALPARQRIAAVGGATAAALAQVGLDPDLVPESRQDSEGLLELEPLQDMRGKLVLILRGQDGRPLLGDSLTQRGARVEYVEVYQRRLPQRSAGNLVRNWERLVQVVTVTSSEILDNLCAMLGPQGVAQLQRTTTIVASRRIAEHARELGLEEVVVAAGAGDQALIKALCLLMSGGLR